VKNFTKGAIGIISSIMTNVGHDVSNDMNLSATTHFGSDIGQGIR